ncbi:MAG: AAA family ATPase [Pyramidobacter sp.]|nr:AAA family ATPase [Pyramidobacter sp.]
MSSKDLCANIIYGPGASASALKREVDRYVIGQEEAKITLCTAVAMHLQRYRMRLADPNSVGTAPNVIVYGPSGSGKTALLRHLARLSGLPMTIESAPSIIPSGGKNGKLITEVLYDLYLKADENLPRTEGGIIVLDEFDKLAVRGDQSTHCAQYMYCIQNDLLTFVEGQRFKCYSEDGTKSVVIDTSAILFVALGAFEGLTPKESSERHVGFSSDLCAAGEGGAASDRKLQLSDWIDYGLKRELLGRMPLRCRINALTEDEYRRILLDSENSPLLELERFFRYRNNSLLLSNQVIDAVIRKASLSGIGARALKSFLYELLQLPLFLHGDRINTTFVVDETFYQTKKAEDLKLYAGSDRSKLTGKKSFSYCDRVLKKMQKKDAEMVDGPF